MEPYWASVGYDYEAANEGELSIYVGDSLYITEVNDQGWVCATVAATTSSKRGADFAPNTLVGWAPADYTVKAEGPEEEATPPAPASNPAPAASEAKSAPESAAPAHLCPGCGTEVTVSYVVYQGKRMHPECFVCSECKCVPCAAVGTRLTRSSPGHCANTLTPYLPSPPPLFFSSLPANR